MSFLKAFLVSVPIVSFLLLILWFMQRKTGFDWLAKKSKRDQYLPKDE